jgi:pimeloyl-ACP methyl ester carboxylesterase
VLLLCCRYFLDLSSSRPGTQFALLQGVGHCPQDDRPELLHQQLLPWLKQRWV